MRNSLKQQRFLSRRADYRSYKLAERLAIVTSQQNHRAVFMTDVESGVINTPISLALKVVEREHRLKYNVFYCKVPV